MKKIILIISAVLLALGILGCAVTALPTLLEGEKYMNNIKRTYLTGVILSDSTSTDRRIK